MKMKIALAALLLAGSASAANAVEFSKPYNIAITGSCDTLTLNVSAGVVVGQSNAPNGCDDGNVIGYQAKLGSGTPPTGKVLIASSTLGTAEQWAWAFNLATGQAELTGTADGVSILQAAFSFTFTRDLHRAVSRPGLPSAVAAAEKQ